MEVDGSAPTHQNENSLPETNITITPVAGVNEESKPRFSFRKHKSTTMSMPEEGFQRFSLTLKDKSLESPAALPSNHNYLDTSSEMTDSEKKSDDPPTLREMMRASAKSLKKAFPSYKELTVADITIGLASVAVEHKRLKLTRQLREQPTLHNKESKVVDKQLHVNPDGVAIEKIFLASKVLSYSNLVYYPIIKYEGQLYHLIESEDETLVSADSISKSKEHKRFRAQPAHNIVKHVSEAKHMKQAFFAKIDEDLNALVISVRGTDSNMDVWTNFTCEPVPLSVHRYYSKDAGDDMVSGTVHGGKLESAKWVLTQVADVIKLLFDRGDETGTDNPYAHVRLERIITVGHSLGGAISTLLSILIREHVVEQKFNTLPDVRAITFASSAFLSYDLSKWCCGFVDSFIVGYDLVPRFSVGQAEKLRNEILGTNYHDTVQEYLQRHRKTNRLVNGFNNFLSKRGRNPLVRSVSKDIIAEDASAKVDIEVNSVPPVVPISYDQVITTLYPPGNLYWFVQEKRQKEKDFSKVLFEYIEHKLSKQEELDQDIDQQMTAKKLFKLWRKEQKIKKKMLKEKITKKKRKTCVVRHVDANHFDRIILTRNVFSDHKLMRYFDIFEYMTSECNNFVL
ncbi:Sn1-specific diacylglycerol lipase alpha [Acrasis kona]|uniref:sn-1-specific diacylglycerol lipase n=1 Tax=Acrasis kona TaxID=1008807 RepID=A0AAW2Z2L3_9EUKA